MLAGVGCVGVRWGTRRATWGGTVACRGPQGRVRWGYAGGRDGGLARPPAEMGSGSSMASAVAAGIHAAEPADLKAALGMAWPIHAVRFPRLRALGAKVWGDPRFRSLRVSPLVTKRWKF